MERFRQGKDVKKDDPYGFETANTPSSKKRSTTMTIEDSIIEEGKQAMAMAIAIRI